MELTDDKYLNRLRAFIRERVASGSKRELLDMTLDTMEKRAKVLNDLASKGVHAEIDEMELEVTIVQTYFLGGELVALAPGVEAAIPSTTTAATQARLGG